MSEMIRQLLITSYILGSTVCFFWTTDNYFSIYRKDGEENVIKILKYITWGRLLYSIVFPAGFILFYVFAVIIYLVIVVADWFDGKHPFAFLKKQVFK